MKNGTLFTIIDCNLQRMDRHTPRQPDWLCLR